MLLLLDNYDSFTYNLQDYFHQLGKECLVKLNNQITIEGIEALNPEAIIISPGPETPSKAGIMMRLINHFHHQLPLLGICLGHQGIGEYFGAELVKAEKPMHGKTSSVTHFNHPLFNSISNPFVVMRYHSLILRNFDQTPMNIIATSESREPMAMVHRELKVCGVQFHPESVLTPDGLALLNNWLHWCDLK